jgi:hypothetical protein
MGFQEIVGGISSNGAIYTYLIFKQKDRKYIEHKD